MPAYDRTLVCFAIKRIQVEYYYSYASQRIQRPPIRCVVVGESNTSVEVGGCS